MEIKNTWDNMPILLTTDEVAQLLCITPPTVRRLARERKLVAKKINNKKYLFDRDLIKQIIMEEKI